MFSGKKKKPQQISIQEFSSLMAENVSFVGDMEFEGGLKINGSFKGNIYNKRGSTSLLALSADGKIEGSVRSYDALIDGTIIGDLHVDHLLELHSNARVSGNITYAQLSMENGACVEGKLICIGEEAQAQKVLELSAPSATQPATEEGGNA